MGKNIITDLDSLGVVIEQVLTEYSDDVREGIGKAAKKVAKNTVDTLKQGGPYQGGEKTGYNQGWAAKTEKDNGDIISITVHNKRAPGLTHLLEKGHATVNGGRTRAFPHIAPAEEKAIEEFKHAVEEVIRNA